MLPDFLNRKVSPVEVSQERHQKEKTPERFQDPYVPHAISICVKMKLVLVVIPTPNGSKGPKSIFLRCKSIH